MVACATAPSLPKGDKSKVDMGATTADTRTRSDVTDPAEGCALEDGRRQVKGTHKSWWEATRDRVLVYGRERMAGAAPIQSLRLE